MIIDEISEYLRRKEEFSAGGAKADTMIEWEWMCGAVELLLRIALANEKRERKL